MKRKPKTFDHFHAPPPVYQEIYEIDKMTVLDYMLERYVAWGKEHREILEEINEYVENLPNNIIPDEIDLDPSFHFNIRHPFQGIRTIQEKLWDQYRLAMEHWEYAHPNRMNSAVYICNVDPFAFGSLEHDQFDTCRSRAIVWKKGTSREKTIYSKIVSSSIRSWLPLNQKVPKFSYISQLIKKGNTNAFDLLNKRVESIWFPELPGINAWDIAYNYAEYLGFRAIKKWAENQFEVV